MTYITVQNLKEITGITGEEVGELGSDLTIRSALITEAEDEFEADVGRTFDGTESDYAIAQRAVAYLTAHKLRLRKLSLLPAVPEGIAQISSPFYKEYQRLVKLLRTAEPDERSQTFDATFQSVEVEDRYSKDSETSHDDMG